MKMNWKMNGKMDGEMVGDMMVCYDENDKMKNGTSNLPPRSLSTNISRNMERTAHSVIYCHDKSIRVQIRGEKLCRGF